MIASVRTHAAKQVVRDIAEIKKGMDATVIPVIKQMNIASDTARVMKTRHYDKYSVLRRARGTVTGLMEATQLRAFYAEILEDIEPRELAAFAQQAVDQGDPILADAILRENFKQPRDRRAFHNQSLLDALPNAEYDAANAMLTQVTALYDDAGLQFAKFGSALGQVSLNRMTYGLNYGLAEDGSVIRNPQGAE